MGFLSRLFGATARDTTLKSPEQWLIDALTGGGPTQSGVAVPWTVSIGLPDVFACGQVIAQDLARTTLKLQHIDRVGNTTDAVFHDRISSPCPVWARA